METVKIKRNTLGDTRTAEKVPTISEFNRANDSHRTDVRSMMGAVAESIRGRGTEHDRMKMFEPERSLFYRELCATIEGKMDFVRDGEWYERHCKEERHHLNAYCPDDVNLIDVIEMICDCVCAGMARSGAVRPVEIRSEILQKAVENTTKMLSDTVILEDSDV